MGVIPEWVCQPSKGHLSYPHTSDVKKVGMRLPIKKLTQQNFDHFLKIDLVLAMQILFVCRNF